MRKRYSREAALILNIESLISAFRVIIFGFDAQDKCVTTELADGNFNALHARLSMFFIGVYTIWTKSLALLSTHAYVHKRSLVYACLLLTFRTTNLCIKLGKQASMNHVSVDIRPYWLNLTWLSWTSVLTQYCPIHFLAI